MQPSTPASSQRTLLDDYRWLTGPAAESSLAWAAAARQPLTAKIAHLRTRLSPQQTHLVLEQATLRARAGAKFAHAAGMFFTPRGLEQATDEVVAAYKAQRFEGRTRVFDLCTGVGGDLLALARRGEAVGFERDPIAAHVADANARVVFHHSARATGDVPPEVRVRDIAGLDVGDCRAWHIDPDRRPSGRRTTLVDLHEPGPEIIGALLCRNPNAAIKLAPAAQMPQAWVERAELEWIGRGRQCRQLVAWFGELATAAGKRRATVLGATPGAARSLVGLPGEEPPAAERIGRYLFEPDAAVLAAKLQGTLAAEYGLTAIAPGIAYWSGDRAIVDDPALACFEVREVLPFRLRPLKAMLRARDVGPLEIKKRGVEQDPAELRRQLNPTGSQPAVLLLARIDKRVTAILARRVGPS